MIKWSLLHFKIQIKTPIPQVFELNEKWRFSSIDILTNDT